MTGKTDGIWRGDYNNSQSDGETMQPLTQVPTSLTLSAEQFEKLYLSPMLHRQGNLAKSLGNPTPLGIGGFLITATPLACCLMSWRGAGGSGAAFSGVAILFGGLLLVLSSILEFILGNTFTTLCFGHLGAFLLAFGATMTPAFNAAAPYSPDGTDTLAGLHAPGFLNTFAFFFLFMGLLMTIYTVCATRTNLPFFLVLLGTAMTFILLAAAYWKLGEGNMVVGNRLTVGAGAALFSATIFGFYLLTAQALDSVGFPVSLPVCDLGFLWTRANKQRDPEMANEANNKQE